VPAHWLTRTATAADDRRALGEWRLVRARLLEEARSGLSGDEVGGDDES
jgi:hypothetical protein